MIFNYYGFLFFAFDYIIRHVYINYNVSEIKNLQDKYTSEIDKFKAEHKVELENSLKVLEERLVDKSNLELQKKDLEMQKLQNEVDNLKGQIVVKK